MPFYCISHPAKIICIIVLLRKYKTNDAISFVVTWSQRTTKPAIDNISIHLFFFALLVSSFRSSANLFAFSLLLFIFVLLVRLFCLLFLFVCLFAVLAGNLLGVDGLSGQDGMRSPDVSKN